MAKRRVLLNMQGLLLAFLLLASLLETTFSFSSFCRSSDRRVCGEPTQPWRYTFQLAGSNNIGPGNVRRPPNEFSRTYRADSIVAAGRRRDYVISISAEENELDALAKRFNIANIAKLNADLKMRHDSSGGSSTYGENGDELNHFWFNHNFVSVERLSFLCKNSAYI